MKYTGINIQGNLISEEILQKIEEADIRGQLAKDFGFEPGINIRSEIEYAWSRIKLDWKHFFDRTDNLPSSDPYGTTLSRRWMVSFFNTLGFEPSLQKASLQGNNEQMYSISHICDHLDGLPLHIVGFYDPSHPEKNTLDIRSSGGTSRLSPHATVQEYLNVTEHLYALVTNGFTLRLVRDSGHLVRMTYIEFDLKRLLEEDKYSEFTLLYRLIHSSRFPKSRQDTDQCILEKYYQDSIESGNRIRDGLSGAVKESLIALGNGLLGHPENIELREKILKGRPDARDFYHQLLRLIYRLLFLMVTEERDLVFTELKNDGSEPDIDDFLNGVRRPTKKQKEIYYNFYSIIRLRKLSQKRYLQENQYTDLWQGLMQTFTLFETGGTGLKLSIQALGSELFSSNAMPDITSGKVNNKVLLQCIKSLNEFEDEKHNLSFINYRALDVEELGSVYEGLLELEPLFEWENGKPVFTFRKGTERSSSGSHYTPEDLVKPLIQHSLEYLIEERAAYFYKGKDNSSETIKKLLDLKICDVACGSGHILLSAARRIALEVARVETGEQQPNPSSFRHALKEVIKNCIYGVDKNPLAVELCKVALWLESHNPGEPLSFLDHRIKCGDAIVGLAHREELQRGIADEAFKKLPGDDKDIASTFSKKNRQERILREKSGQAVQLTTEADHMLMEQVKELNRLIDNFSSLPENTPEEMGKKEKAYRILVHSEALQRLKILADLQIMPFFLQKNENNREFLVTDAQYHRYLRGEIRIPDNTEMKAIEFSVTHRFFHWFLEFPEVFQNGGFNCILGNPPYLGGLRISTNFGDRYLNYLKSNFLPNSTTSDLVAYFLRRNYSILLHNGFISLITTNTVYQGDTRLASLDVLYSQGAQINFALTSIKWPGVANLNVSIFSLSKGNRKLGSFLNGKRVEVINPQFSDESIFNNPEILVNNQNKVFNGSYYLGDGFVLNIEEKNAIIKLSKKNQDVIFPLLIGNDINEKYDQSPTNYIINFFDWPIEKAATYPEPFIRIKELVKPFRDTNKRAVYREKWWIYGERRVGLYDNLKKLNNCFVITATTKYLTLVKQETNKIFAKSLYVFTIDDFSTFSICQSSIHELWARKFSSTLADTFSYTPSTCFETFPFPYRITNSQIDVLRQIGEEYHEFRKNTLLKHRQGLTKVYNAFHGREITEEIVTIDLSKLDKKSLEKQLGKEALYLWNHLQKTEGTCSFKEAVTGIIRLRELHIEMDNAVLEAYGWQDIDLRHDFYEVDYLPENDRVRFTIHPDARKEVLKRLLELNHKIHDEEVKAGLWDDKKKDTKKNLRGKSEGDKVCKPGDGYGNLFNEKK